MNEFLYHNAGFLTKLLELLAALTGLFYFKKYMNTPVKYFIYFLWYVFFIEAIGGYTVYIHKYEFLSPIKKYLSNTLMRRNNWWYTIFWTIGSTLFYSFYFRLFLTNSKFKVMLKYLALCFVVFSVSLIIYKWDEFFITTITAIRLFSTLLIALSILFFLVEVLKSEKILEFYKSINVYISLSVLLWTIVTVPLVFFSIYFNKADWDFVYLKTNVFLFANVFLYFCFIIGLVVSKPRNSLT